jgi:predicted nucleotidyltransferase
MQSPPEASPVQPTPYADVNRVLALLLAKQRQVLGENFVGLYLAGSLAAGDFDPGSSDLDFLAVTERPVADPVLPQLHAMHQEIAATGLYWASHLEGSYIDRAALRRYDPANCRHPSVGVDWAFAVGEHDQTWVLWRWILRQKGVTVWGPPPHTLIDPVSRRALREAVAAVLLGPWTRHLQNPDWLRARNYQAFAVLTMCRARHTLQTGRVVTKPEAAAWAKAAFPAWAYLIDRALLWRQDTSPDAMTDMLAFVRETVDMAHGQGRP